MTLENSPKVERDWLKRWSLYAPNKSALIDHHSNTGISYQSLFHLSCQMAQVLKSRYGIRRGERIATLSRNDWRMIPLYFAIERLGGILVPLNFRLAPAELEYLFADCEPRLILTSSDQEEKLSGIVSFTGHTLNLQHFFESCLSAPTTEIADYADFDETSMILYTSGTTGAPKGAMITPQMIFWNSINTGLRLNLTENDLFVSFMPLFHTGGWNVLLTPFLHRGATIVLIDKFEADLVLDLIDRYSATILFGVPTMLDMMARSQRFAQTQLSSVRYAVVGGEPMPLPLIDLWQKRGIPIRQGYGLTEFGPNVFSLNAEDSQRKIGSIGFPNFYVEAEVLNEDHHKLGSGEVGELVLRGPVCMKGYWKHPQATAETIRDGWLHTGDLVKRDEDGYYYVVGRKKDMFISGGENVYPAEIEKVLLQCPEIQEAAVVGVPDPKWGEVGFAFFMAKNKADLNLPERLETWCLERLAKFKTPKYFHALAELPKGDSGKILKRALKEHALLLYKN